MRYMTLAEFYERYTRDRRKPETFWSGFLDGFGAMFYIGPHPFDPPRYPRDARHQDWVRIGNDMRAAMRRLDEELGARDGETCRTTSDRTGEPE